MLFGVSVIRIQVERDQPVSNGIFLAVPAPKVGLSEFSCLHSLPCRDYWDQFWGGEGSWSRHCLPSFLPKILLMRSEIGAPVFVRSGTGHRSWLQLAPITNESYLDLYRGIKRIGSRQRKAGRCYFA